MKDEDADLYLPPSLPPVGAKVYHIGVLRNLYHVRAHVDGEYAVMRTWHARTGWRYVVEHAAAFNLRYPLYTKKKRG